MKQLLFLGVLATVGCVDSAGGRDRDVPPTDAGVPTPGEDAVAAEDDAGADSAPAPTDATPPEPDAAPIPEACNGEDEDGDGRVDEGVANACGGCGGIPPGGCQAWSINLVQDGEALLDPSRVVFRAANILGTSTFAVDNGQCDQIRIATTADPDGHLGEVAITAVLDALALSPGTHPATGAPTYDTDPPSSPLRLHQSGDVVTVSATGGRAVAPFETALTAPETLSAVDAASLDPWIAAARGEGADAPLNLSWVAGSGDLRLYVGGSKQVFGLTPFYRAIEHYLLDIALDDDGELSLPGDLFGEGSPNSSVWAYLSRTRSQQLPLDQHAVALEIGQRVERRASGGAEEADSPPFQIVNPSPNERVVQAGFPLPVRWSALPPGVGPLTVQLLFRNEAIEEQHVISCTVEDPVLGALEIPAEIMAAWPEDAGFRQLSLRWPLFTQPVAGEDEGGLSRSLTMILRLDR